MLARHVPKFFGTSPILRVHYDGRILHRCSCAGRTIVGIRTASSIAFGMAGHLDSAGLRAIRSKLLALRAGAVIKLRIPGLGGAGVAHPSYLVALFHMDSLVLFEHLSGVVNMHLMHLLAKGLDGPEQQRRESKAIQVGFHL